MLWRKTINETNETIENCSVDRLQESTRSQTLSTYHWWPTCARDTADHVLVCLHTWKPAWPINPFNEHMICHRRYRQTAIIIIIFRETLLKNIKIFRRKVKEIWHVLLFIPSVAVAWVVFRPRWTVSCQFWIVADIVPLVDMSLTLYVCCVVAIYLGRSDECSSVHCTFRMLS